ncbi:hypothetical protein RchiOBHm_Chr1g0321711 [Rosa chinensis]|uniref:Uncharacterized protein n=1 Tax=Rosa chinensis TaxID=74649 RepID=A0A2P6S927_ROSCH|nr:hypothetical protein RchiOBHm_Chr1g0321711 [Rosa chinensis]
MFKEWNPVRLSRRRLKQRTLKNRRTTKKARMEEKENWDLSTILLCDQSA